MQVTYGNQSFLGTLVLAAALGSALAQAPTELVLKAKVRDFVDRTSGNVTVNPHPHFYGDVPHQPLCNSVAQGVTMVLSDIAVDDGAGDTALFKGDNRGPRLRPDLDPRVSQCFEPQARFSDWYNDVTGVNRSFLVDLRFTFNAALQRYEYFNDTFFPIDNGAAFQPLGAYAPYGHQVPGHTTHNYGFTLELHANFTYFKGKGQTFTFRGDDDVWVFINGKRVIDLGGMHESQDATVSLDAIAASIGLADSLVYPLDFFFAERHVTTSMLRISTDLELEPVLDAPAITPGGFFQDQKSVTLTHTSPQATLYYTTNGSLPTSSSQVYTGPITVSSTTTIRAIAVRPGYRNSPDVSATYTKMQTVATPVADPRGQVFVNPIQVALAVATDSAVIRYTLDGLDPTETSPVYAGPIPMAATATLKARAFRANWIPSAVMTEVYTDAGTLPPPVANPVGGGFTTSQTVTLAVPGHADAAIHYTLDGSEPTAASLLYAGPFSFDRTTVVKARAFKTDWKPSQTMTESYTRLAAGVRGVYVDADGDGRIETAILRLDVAPAAIPASVTLKDPFDANAESAFESSRITQGASPELLVVRFPDKPFKAGTAFAAAPLASFPAAPGFAPAAFSVSDSAGPVPLKAVSRNKATPEDRASVDITFSEPIDLARLQAGKDWPFDILRNGAVETRGVRVYTIEPVAGQPNTYRWTFEVNSPAWPVFIDSLTLARSPVVHDAGGMAGVAGGKRIGVEGAPVTLPNAIRLDVRHAVTLDKPQVREVLPVLVRQNPFGVVHPSTGACLSCPPGGDRFFDVSRPLPEWELRTKYPVQYIFTIYDHLGNYVTKTEGRITEAMIAAVPQDPDGLRTLVVRWHPVAYSGDAAGSGAYILKGTVFNRMNEAQKGLQGEDQVVTASSVQILKKFGYLRQY